MAECWLDLNTPDGRQGIIVQSDDIDPLSNALALFSAFDDDPPSRMASILIDTVSYIGHAMDIGIEQHSHLISGVDNSTFVFQPQSAPPTPSPIATEGETTHV